MDLGFFGCSWCCPSVKFWEWGAMGPPWDPLPKIKSSIFPGFGDFGATLVALSRSPGRICDLNSLHKLLGRQLRAAQTPRGQ